jgi:hypothetical protein
VSGDQEIGVHKERSCLLLVGKDPATATSSKLIVQLYNQSPRTAQHDGVMSSVWLRNTMQCSLQVIPAKGSAVFPICLNSPEPKGFSHKVEYVINGFHFFDFEVNAEVIAAKLDVSQTELTFHLALDDWLPYTDQVLLLHNPTKIEAQYEWVNSCPGLFNVSPMTGSVPARSSCENHIRWAPRPASGTAKGLCLIQPSRTCSCRVGHELHCSLSIQSYMPTIHAPLMLTRAYRFDASLSTYPVY